MKDPDVNLEKILGGLTKMLTQLHKHNVTTDTLIANQEAAIEALQVRKKKTEAVRDRTAQISANLADLLAVPKSE